MSDVAGVIRVPHSDRAGTGLVAWEAMDPATLESGAPTQRGWFCDEDPDTGYMAGVWDCTAFTDRPGAYGVDEFMLLLEGSVIMALPCGTEVTVKAGEAFVIPKGLECQWKMPGYVRKVFMIVDDPAPDQATTEPNPSLTRVTVPDLSAAAADPEDSVRLWFESATGQMDVSVITAASEPSETAAAPAHELTHVLQGSLTLKTQNGAETFAAGETCYLRAGTEVARHCTPGTRLLVARYAPAA
ncbi:MAG: cupin domain-containing protein [Pseudomonadota bacterium]